MRVVVWGDSIVWGKGSSNGGWVDMWKRDTLMNSIEVYNLGVCGENSDKLKVRFEVELEGFLPDVCVIGIGTNDSQLIVESSECRVSLDSFRNNLTEMVGLCMKRDVKIVLLSTLVVDEEICDPLPRGVAYRNNLLRQYDGVIAEVAEEFGCEFVDLSGVLGVGDLYDGLHPNDLGYEKVYEYILQEIVV